jgi:glycosyltransferase involved in cell wall biosynthesis
MKVCFVCPYAYPVFEPAIKVSTGGAEVEIYNISRALARNGLSVDVVVSDHGQREIEVRDGVRLIRSSKVDPSPGPLGKLRDKLALLRALSKSDADAIVTICADPDIGLIAGYARLTRRKFVYRTAHQIDCTGEYEREAGWRGRLFGLGLRWADAVATQHEEHEQVLRERGIDSTVIRNGFDILSAPGNAKRPIDVLWVARCATWKNPELFLDLAEQLPGRNLVMICPMQSDDPDLFRKVRERAEAIPHLRFIERVPYSQIQPYYEQAKVFVGTSDFEGFPNTYLQACMAGTPIASYGVDPGEFLATTGAGFVANRNFERLHTGIAALLDDETAWSRASRNARAYVETHHNMDIEGPKWERLLAGLA